MEPKPRGPFSSKEMVALMLFVCVLGLSFFLGFSRRTVADQRATTIIRMQQVETALRDYAIDSGGMFPTTGQGLRALLEEPATGPQPPAWQGPYLDDARTIRDGWGYPFNYVAPGAGDPPRPYDLWSNGANRAEGGVGPDADICSWDRSTQLP